jgi:hypothetical protein
LVLFELGDAEDLARKLIWVATHSQETYETTRRGQAVYLDHAWSREREKLLEIGVSLLQKDGK